MPIPRTLTLTVRPKQQRLANEPPRFGMAAFCFTVCSSVAITESHFSIRFVERNDAFDVPR